MKKEQLHSYLRHGHRGKAAAVSGSELAKTMGVSGNELRRLVNRLRRDGIPIASSSSGYFYAANAGEVYSTIRSLRKMESGLKAAIAGLERAMTDFSQGESP